MKNQSYFIKGFPDYRLVRLSESGFCVLSKKKGYWKEIGYDRGDGHIYVTLFGDYVRHTHLHVLVAEMFVPIPEEYKNVPREEMVVHHIDGDAKNNDPANNLMWLTTNEHNKLHKKSVKLTEETRRKMSQKKRGRKPHWLLKPVEQWSKDGKTLIARYESISEAERQTGIANTSISACCNGKLKSAGGYIWRYAD